MSKLLWPNGKKTPGSVWHEYGPRKPIWTSNGYTSSFHHGIDIGPWDGQYHTWLLSPVDGTVTYAGYSDIFGYRVIVREHSSGDTFWLCHMRVGSLQVRTGDTVRAGDRVGYMGETGKASGVHIHYEVHPDGGSAVNPRTYYENRYAAAASIESKPFTPAPDEEVLDLSEEDDMQTFIIKRAGKNEWSLLDPDIGTDLPRLTGSAERKHFRAEKTKKGVVNTFRGFCVTTDPDVAAAWGRSYARQYGHAPQERPEGDYQIAQLEASRLSAEKHRA